MTDTIANAAYIARDIFQIASALIAVSVAFVIVVAIVDAVRGK